MGATAGIAMGLNTIAGGAASYAGASMQADAYEAQGDFQRQQFETNARLANMQSDDATRRGEIAATKVRQQARQVIGSQRSSIAAQGIEVNADSALDVQSDTAALAAEDAQTIKNNAWREAWGYKVQANQYQAQGKQAQNAGRTNARMTLAAGGAKAASAAGTGLMQMKDSFGGFNIGGSAAPKPSGPAYAGQSYLETKGYA